MHLSCDQQRGTEKYTPSKYVQIKLWEKVWWSFNHLFAGPFGLWVTILIEKYDINQDPAPYWTSSTAQQYRSSQLKHILAEGAWAKEFLSV